MEAQVRYAFLLLFPLAFLLAGCEFLFDAGAVEGAAGAGGEAALASSSAAEAAGGVAEIAVSEDTFALAQDRGILSKALDRITANGTRAGRLAISRSGQLIGDGRIIGQIDPTTGDISGPRNIPAGELSASDARIYEYGPNGVSRPIGELHGFTDRSDVRLSTRFNGRTSVRVIPRQAYLDVLKVGADRYLVRLADGTEGYVAASAVNLFIIGLQQTKSQCDANRSGALVLKSSETVAFARCEEQDQQINVETADGPQAYYAHDVAMVLVGGENGQNASQLGSRLGFGRFELAVLQSDARQTWRRYRPTITPEHMALFRSQFPRLGNISPRWVRNPIRQNSFHRQYVRPRAETRAQLWGHREFRSNYLHSSGMSAGYGSPSYFHGNPNSGFNNRPYAQRGPQMPHQYMPHQRTYGSRHYARPFSSYSRAR